MKISRGHSCQSERWDGPDYVHDVRLARRLKRRSIANQLNHKYSVNGSRRPSSKNCCHSTETEDMENDAGTEEDEVDHDYKYFLDNLVHLILDTCDDSDGGSDFDDDRSCESDNDDDDDIDPDHKMFMDNLREDGNSYVLEVFADKQLMSVKYEKKQVENVSNGHKSDTPNKRPGSDVSPVAKQKCNSEVECDLLDEDYLGCLNSTPTGGKSMVYASKTGVKKVYRENDSRFTMMGSPMEPGKGLETKRGVPGKGNSSIVGQKVQVSNEKIGAPNKRPTPSVPCSARNKCSNELQCDNVEESYEEFLSLFRLNDDGFVYIPNGGNTKIYEHEGGSSSDSELVIVEPDQFDEEGNWSTERGIPGKGGNSSIFRQKVQVSNEEIGAPNKGPTPSVPYSAKSKHSNELQCDDVDEDYEEFLSLSRFNDDGFVYMSNGGNTKVYGHEGGCSSDSELVIVEPDEFDEDTPFVPASDYDKSYCENTENLAVGNTRARAMYAIYSSQFRKGLMQKLERPYDQKEHEGYWQEVSRRRKKERHMEGREGRTKSVPLNGFDKSYLELHCDLAQAIDQAKEPNKVLFLLRGFFYWLEYQPHQGAFRPWLDKSCMEMLEKL